MKRTILIIHPGALGDVLLAVPAIRSLSARFPQHETMLIASATVSRLLLECGLIAEWISLEGQACLGLFSGTAAISRELQSWLNRCDLVVAWMEDKDGELRSLFQELGVARVQIQSPFSKKLCARHQRDRFLETLGETAGDSSSLGTVPVPSHLLERGQDYLDSLRISRDRSLVLVHPGSGSPYKCLGPKKMAFILQQLQQKGLCPLVLEGPADHDAVECALKLVGKKSTVLKDCDLPLLAGILAHTALYLGHDSGITHLSALLGVRTVAVFGPTDHSRWAPIGDHVTILRGVLCICPSWEAVRTCHEKPCLDVSIEKMLMALGLGTETGVYESQALVIPDEPALSLPESCDTVPR